jgi:type IV secretory pathway VirB10-like protein
MLLLFWTGGCEQAPAPPPQQQTARAPVPPPPPPPPPVETPAASPSAPAAPTPPAPQEAAKPTNAGSKKAEVGVGKKLSRLSKSLICTDFAALYCVRERLVFEVQIPKAMQLFNATEGRNPKSHAEFMEKIIKEGQIQLPELWEGETYRYDPKTAELWVDPPPADK